MKGLKTMKKTLSLFLALVIAAICLVPAFAQDEQKGIAVINETSITKDLVAQYEGYTEFYFTSSVTIEKDAFKDSGAKVLLFRGKAGGLDACGAENAVIILPNTINGTDNVSGKNNVSYLSECSWFSYEIFSIFGKTILAFLYEPQISADNCAWYDKLLEDINPDYIYFESLNDYSSDFYVLNSVSGMSIAKDEFGKITNPGFFQKLILRFSLNGLEDKSFYDSNPSAKGFSFIYNLFRKKK